MGPVVWYLDLDRDRIINEEYLIEVLNLVVACVAGGEVRSDECLVFGCLCWFVEVVVVVVVVVVVSKCVQLIWASCIRLGVVIVGM